MKKALKPLWIEGTMLSQQHFQQWEQHLSMLNKFRFQLTSKEQWGLIALTVEREAMLRHQLFISCCEVMFQNHELCCDDLAEDNLILDLSQHNTPSLSVYLCLVDDDRANKINGYPKYNQRVRWSAQYTEVADQLDDQRRHEVLLATNNLYLSTEEPSKKSIQYIELIRLTRDDDEFYQIDERYIPPLIVLDANPYLAEAIITVESNLRRKLVSLRHVSTFFHKQESNRWIVAEISRCVNKLSHYRRQRYTPLNDYYQCLIDVCLCMQVFLNPGNEIIEWDYQHDDLANSFMPLCEVINKSLLQINKETPHNIIHIRKTSTFMYCIEWQKLPLKQLALYLLVKNPESKDNWQHRFLQQTKLAPTSAIELCIASAVQGFELVHCREYPLAIERQSGWECFSVIVDSDGWSCIQKEKSLSLFLSDEFSRVTIKMVESNE